VDQVGASLGAVWCCGWIGSKGWRLAAWLVKICVCGIRVEVWGLGFSFFLRLADALTLRHHGDRPGPGSQIYAICLL
jgi:hypothetical protein